MSSNAFDSNFAKRLRLARTLKGFSQQELANEVNATRQFINQLESSVRSPSEEKLQELCSILSVQKHFFSIPLKNEVTPENCHFRKRKTTKQSLANQVASYGTIFDDFIDLLQSYVSFPSSEPLHILEDSETHIEPSLSMIETYAERFRVKLGLGTDTPIDNVTNILEHCGVFVTTFREVSDKVDALSFSTKYNVVLRNPAKESLARQRFDLSHELGHLILHQGIQTGEGQYEKQADHFASSFLFPRNSFINEFKFCLTPTGRFRWAAVLELKKRWNISQRAIVYRAHSLGLINSKQYRNANIYLSTNSNSKNQEELDDTLPMEKPTLITSAIEQIENGLNIDFKKLANAIGFEAEYLSELLSVKYIKRNESNIFLMHPKITPI